MTLALLAEARGSHSLISFHTSYKGPKLGFCCRWNYSG